MEVSVAVEKRRPVKETPLQRLKRDVAAFAVALLRVLALSLLLSPLLIASFLTVDLPFRLFDGLAAPDAAYKPSDWLSIGGVIMAGAPLLGILFARRFGGEEASRAVTASWGLAALATFAELSYLAPALEASDMPAARYVMAFVASAMAGQYLAVNIYDVIRGGGRWWRAPLYAALAGYALETLIYFPGVYAGSGAPWINWMIGGLAVRALIAFLFLPIYALLRNSLKPRGGYGGK
ncbi:MAG: VUT family protein [Parvularculaceae bacterium]